MSLNNFSFDLLRLIRRRELMLHVDFITVKIYQDLESVQRQKTPAIRIFNVSIDAIETGAEMVPCSKPLIVA